MDWFREKESRETQEGPVGVNKKCPLKEKKESAFVRVD